MAGHPFYIRLVACLLMLASARGLLLAQSETEGFAFADSVQVGDAYLHGRAVGLPADSLALQPSPAASEAVSDNQAATQFQPDSNKALWYAALCPGLGQIYNRRYWKLPIVAGGVVGITYAISWNNKYYQAYTMAYRDLIDNDPSTNYYEELLPAGSRYSESQLNTLFKNRQQSFRRQRDLSIIIGAGFYLICLLDAYVDAELYNFDISDNLSLHWEEASQSFNLSLSLHF